VQQPAGGTPAHRREVAPPAACVDVGRATGDACQRCSTANRTSMDRSSRMAHRSAIPLVDQPTGERNVPWWRCLVASRSPGRTQYHRRPRIQPRSPPPVRRHPSWAASLTKKDTPPELHG
jgi:hypothetical protein